MSVIWRVGVAWLRQTLEAAERHDMVDRVSDLVLAYKGDEPMTAMPGLDQIRIVRDGTTAILSPTGVVIGFRKADAESAPSGPESPTPTRRKRRKRSVRGPRDRDELAAWLAEGGYQVELDGGHAKVVDSKGSLIYTLSSTPSDWRTHSNEVNGLRRATGLTLRKG